MIPSSCTADQAAAQPFVCPFGCFQILGANFQLPGHRKKAINKWEMFLERLSHTPCFCFWLFQWGTAAVLLVAILHFTLCLFQCLAVGVLGRGCLRSFQGLSSKLKSTFLCPIEHCLCLPCSCQTPCCSQQPQTCWEGEKPVQKLNLYHVTGAYYIKLGTNNLLTCTPTSRKKYPRSFIQTCFVIKVIFCKNLCHHLDLITVELKFHPRLWLFSASYILSETKKKAQNQKFELAATRFAASNADTYSRQLTCTMLPLQIPSTARRAEFDGLLAFNRLR